MNHTATAHIICNQEIGMTECGSILPYMEVSDPTPWIMGRSGDVAHWDNEEPPSNTRSCSECWTAYMATH